MERELVFHILGIEDTSDEETIKDAYITLLKQTNPEDDPEGFKRLREAYETAVSYAGRADLQEAEDQEKTEVEQWLDRVRDVYEDMERRRQQGEWAALLADPVCEELDTSFDAREVLLRFLMDHIYLPGEIWKMIDQTFHITAELKELKERFPINFLNYVKYYVENEGFICYQLFQTADPKNQNGDQYLEHYNAIKRKLDQDDTAGVLEELADLKAFGLYHPYEDVEKMRIYLKNGQKELAAELGTELLHSYSRDNYIKVWAAEVLYQTDKKEAAYMLWQEILKEQPMYYHAQMGSSRYLMDQGDYYQAREQLLTVLDGSNQDDAAVNLLKECNNHLIEEYTRKLEAQEADANLSDRDMRIERGWCLFQNERITDAIKSIEDFQPDEDSLYDFTYLYGWLLFQDKQYQKARPYLEQWLELIEKTVDDGTDKIQRRLSRRCRALNILGSCLHELGEGELAEEYLRKAVTAAGNLGERLGVMNHLAHFLLKLKQYEKAVDVCDEILKDDDRYYPAYLNRQEACYELGKAQEVVNDYHRAVEIYPGYYKPYLLAAEIFFYHRQYEDGKGVIERARENNVPFSDKLKLFEVKHLRNLAKSAAERKQPMQILQELSESRKEDSDLVDPSEIEFEMALLEWDDNRLDQALNHLRQAIRENPQRRQYHLVQGHIYLEQKLYQEALGEYGAAADYYQDEPSLYYNRGLCYEGLDLQNLAIESFEKTLELKDTYRDACEKLSDYYKALYDKYNRLADLEKAISYISRELKEQQPSYYLMERGRLYLGSFQFEKAIEDFEKALEEVPDGWAGHNNLGCCYKYMGQFERAIECFKRAVAGMKSHKSLLPYSNMADCYEILDDYQAAIHCYEEDLKLFPDQLSFWEEIGDLYLYMNDTNQARAAYEHMKSEDSYYSRVAGIYEKKGQILRALRVYIKGIRNADIKNFGSRWFDLACFADVFIPAIAAFAYKKAIKNTDSMIDRFRYEQMLSTFYYRMKKFEQAKQYAQSAMDSFRETKIKEADYVEYPPGAPSRLRNMALIYMALGEIKTFEAYLEKMDQIPRCRGCRRDRCYDKYYYRGIYREANGDLEGAMADYLKSQELNPTGVFVARLITMLKRKMKA